MMILLTALLCASASVHQDSVESWLHEIAIPMESESGVSRLAQELQAVRVLGLGEATHGQEEVFQFKRELTLELVREHGFRLVAYEADATGAQALNRYVQGETDDIESAMDGFGMMIWRVEANRALLQELRLWNERAAAGDRVEMIGVDVQDARGAGKHLHELLASALPDLALEAQEVAASLLEARNAAYGGDREGVAPAQERLAAFSAKLFHNWGRLAAMTSREQADEAMRCARELARFPVDPMQPAWRDRGMADTLLDALALRPAGTKAVLLGHNGHITRGPLRSMGTTETGCGGHLRAALGEAYYSVGVAFGSGGFQALHRDEDGKWWFRRYSHGAPPAETVGHFFLSAGLSSAFFDLRSGPSDGPVREWLDQSCGIRSWGGYGVPEDPDAANEEGRGLAWTILSEDYDGLLFFEKTTSAQPFDAENLWK